MTRLAFAMEVYYKDMCDNKREGILAEIWAQFQWYWIWWSCQPRQLLLATPAVLPFHSYSEYVRLPLYQSTFSLNDKQYENIFEIKCDRFLVLLIYKDIKPLDRGENTLK